MGAIGWIESKTLQRLVSNLSLNRILRKIALSYLIPSQVSALTQKQGQGKLERTYLTSLTAPLPSRERFETHLDSKVLVTTRYTKWPRRWGSKFASIYPLATLLGRRTSIDFHVIGQEIISVASYKGTRRDKVIS